jgi:hypothetical protein
MNYGADCFLSFFYKQPTQIGKEKRERQYGSRAPWSSLIFFPENFKFKDSKNSKKI